jgi:hypothetical protein
MRVSAAFFMNDMVAGIKSLFIWKLSLLSRQERGFAFAAIPWDLPSTARSQNLRRTWESRT